MTEKPTRRGAGGRYHHGDLKAALRTTGHRRLADDGVGALSLRELARESGVSHAAVYRHYADREALLADLAADGFEELVRLHHEAIAATTDGPAERLKACGRAYVRFGLERPHLLQLMFSRDVGDWARHPALVEASSRLADLLHGLIRDGQAAGGLRAGDPRELALSAWSTVHGLTLLLVGRHVPGVTVDEAFAEQAARRCTDLVIEGIGANGTALPGARSGG